LIIEARRALRALKGLVKLQALVRGHNVRKQAKITLQYMQALARVQDRVRDHRARLSHEGSRRSMFSETNSPWEFKYLHEIRERKSMVSPLQPYEPISQTILKSKMSRPISFIKKNNYCICINSQTIADEKRHIQIIYNIQTT
jgi:hypothetical protein